MMRLAVALVALALLAAPLTVEAQQAGSVDRRMRPFSASC
jgi:hypothetical protein